MPTESKKLFGIDVPTNLEPIVIVLDNSGENDTVRFRNDDIKDEILDNLGDHTAQITKDAGNEPTIRPGSEEVTTRTQRGNPAELGDTNGAAFTFKDTFNSADAERAIASFEQSSNSKLLPFDIRKGKTDDKSTPSGIDIIQEVNAQGKNSSIAQAIQSIALENNRYACEAEYVDPDSRPDEDDSNVGNAILQEELGKHSPRNFPNVVGSGKDIQFKVRKLKNLGLQTLLEASGEYFVPDDTDDFASLVAAKAASSAPGLARLGIRIPVNRFSAATIAQEVNSDFRKESRFPELNGPQRFSHGSVNNPLVPFSAVSSTSAGIAAVLLAITISTLVKALADLLGPDPLVDVNVPDPMGEVFGSNGQSGRDQSLQRKNRLGSYLGKDKNPQRENSTLPVPGALGIFTGNFFILEPTQEPYSKAVARGSEIFFGQVNNGVLGLVGAAFGLGDSFKHVSENPGYYNVLLRMLVKSTVESIGDVVNSVVGLGASIVGETNPIAGTVLGKSALDIDREIGLENDPTNLLNVVNSIRESKMLKFMDILATIGDISLMTENTDGFDPTDLFESSIDGVRDFVDEGSYPNPAALVKKNRLSSNVGGRMGDHLAWGSNTLRSLYLLPTSFASAELQYKGSTKIYDLISCSPGHKQNTESSLASNDAALGKPQSNRLSSGDVAAIERELDAYYMPFYFHDLRTNEILSFHAFIENITDTHDASYTETEGYGRIGKVYTYKNTNRSIGCSFKVVATSPTDFSEMWYKINKLVLMLYPQYTTGRQVSFVGNDGVEKKFIQPFSQLIGNSPMIRFRLGDLIKSNFSDIDLARMFGVGTDQFKVSDADPPAASVFGARAQKICDTMRTITKKHLSADFEVGDKFILNSEAIAGSRRPQTAVVKTLDGRVAKNVPSKTTFIVQEVKGAKKYIITPSEPIDILDNQLVVNFNSSIPQGLIETSPGFVFSKAVDQVGPGPEENISQETLEQIASFFDPTSNPIVKSFDSVTGQGLPGFIKRLSFDWSESRWDTEGLNNRAPMWMKIDIEFAPINDINPGLDSSGAPIGMPYNVGAMLKLLKVRRASDGDLNEESSAYSAAKALASTPLNASSAEGLSLSDPLSALSNVKLGI